MEDSVVITQPTSIWDKGKLFIKAIVIFILAIALWIPTSFITGLVREREGRQREAIADISSKWAGRQTVTGPLLMIPYNSMIPDGKGGMSSVKQYAYFLADQMQVNAKVIPEKRYRGIYQVVVYRSEISIAGKFGPLKWESLKIPRESILWEEAAIIFRVSDHIKGINQDIDIKWNDTTVRLNPQAPGFSGYDGALTATIPFNAASAANDHNFTMSFLLNGSEQLLFAGSARDNKLVMQSSWDSPSFTGARLPDTREVSDSGFTAKWQYLNRVTPQVWTNTTYNFDTSSIGADLVISVDSYDKTLRSVKYALLCIILTFSAFFLIESIYKKPLHLVQYGLAGLALVLFYTLLLSISEYLSFNLAYLLAAAATIGLVVWFIGSIMKSSKLAAFIALVLTVVYAYIFCIIQMQDYSLLMGSIGLFVALAIIMYFSRKLQWS